MQNISTRLNCNDEDTKENFKAENLAFSYLKDAQGVLNIRVHAFPRSSLFSNFLLWAYPLATK